MNLKRISHELKDTVWILQDSEIIVNPTTKFILPSNYPFVCPQLMIHGNTHIHLLKMELHQYAHFCKSCHIEVYCICCRSITSRWSPCYTCKDVYHEYILFKKYIFNIRMLHKLYQKNIPDVIIKEISSYLLL